MTLLTLKKTMEQRKWNKEALSCLCNACYVKNAEKNTVMSIHLTIIIPDFESQAAELDTAVLSCCHPDTNYEEKLDFDREER